MLSQINWCDLESILLFETTLFLFILASCIGTTTKILLCSLIICFEWSFDIVRNLMVQLNSIMLSNQHWFTSAWCYVYLLQMKSVKNFLGRSHVVAWVQKNSSVFSGPCLVMWLMHCAVDAGLKVHFQVLYKWHFPSNSF